MGRPLPSIQALKCATGQAGFTDDIPVGNGDLAVVLIQSTIAFGRIKTLDASAALEMEGVEGFFCAKDVPEGRNKWKDEKMFADEVVEYEGDILGAIVAVDEKTARRAAKLVKVEYEEQPPITTLEEAIEKKNILAVPEGTTCHHFKKGNLDEALAQSERVIEGWIKTPRQEHFYEECSAVLVRPGEDDELDVYAACCMLDQHTICAALGLPFHKV